jgi:PAS domain S-box-containing protein
MIGVLTFDATRKARDWPDPLQKQLQLVAQVFANALDRMHADQKLKESEARLSLAADSANAGLWTLEPETGHIWATGKTYELLGLLPDKGIDVEKFLDVVHPDDRETIRSSIQEATRSGRDTAVEYRIVRADGSARWIASSRSPGVSRQ